MTPSGVILLLPTTTSGQQGPVAALLSTAGWASAAERVVGAAWIVTPSGVVDAETARRRGSAPHLASPTTTSWRRRIPTVVKTAVKDVRQARRAHHFHVPTPAPWATSPVSFVWQRHELFHTQGPALADQLGVPSVLFVPATPVWESAQWGIKRPGWNHLAEQWGERPALKAATLIACGSEVVAEQVVRIGVPEDHLLITPTGVDLDLFPAETSGDEVRRRLGLGDRFVVGWVGSFRRFHALEILIDALTGLEGASLLLVGDGPERAGLEDRAQEQGVDVVATGTVRHTDLASHLAAMDVAVVPAPSAGSFHYSPLKLAEYLAAGRAVIAPKVPQIMERLHDGADVLLVEPGDPMALAGAIRRLRDEPALRATLASGARAVAAEGWSWDRQVQRILAALDDRR